MSPKKTKPEKDWADHAADACWEALVGAQGKRGNLQLDGMTPKQLLERWAQVIREAEREDASPAAFKINTAPSIVTTSKRTPGAVTKDKGVRSLRLCSYCGTEGHDRRNCVMLRRRADDY